MKKIILFRHAKAAQAEPGMRDFDRPLKERGKKDAILMGERIKARGISPDLILSSPAKRAKKTAKLVARQIGYSKDRIQYDQKIYDTNASYLFKLLKAQDDRHDIVMLFGHNPDLSLLTESLLVQQPDFSGLPTAGVSCIEFDVDHWEQLKKGQGRAVFIDYPKRDSE